MKFTAELKIVVEVPEEYHDCIFENARRHYDSTVSEAAEQGGFIWGDRNRLKHFKQTELEWSWRQIDYMMKALEGDMTVLAVNVRLFLHSVLQSLGAQQGYINKILSGE